MLSYPICHIYRTWKSINIAWGEILKLSYGGEGGGANQKEMESFLWEKVTSQDTM